MYAAYDGSKSLCVCNHHDNNADTAQNCNFRSLKFDDGIKVFQLKLNEPPPTIMEKIYTTLFAFSVITYCIRPTDASGHVQCGKKHNKKN